MSELPIVVIALALAASLLIGAWTGLSDYSGWPLVVPVLFVIYRVPLFESVLTSILLDWVNALAATGVYVRRRDADVRVATWWAAVSAPVILCGALVAFALLQRWSGLLEGGAGPIGVLLGLALLVRATHPPSQASPTRNSAGRLFGRARSRTHSSWA